MGFGESQSCRSDESLILGGFSSKTWSHKRGFSNHPLPLLGCKRNVRGVGQRIELVVHS